MSKIYQLTEELTLDISTVDKLTGPAMGRPGTGTFRLSDLVGLDTAVKVIEGIQTNCTDDEQIHQLKMPSYLTHLVENKWLGNKSGKGFYTHGKTQRTVNPQVQSLVKGGRWVGEKEALERMIYVMINEASMILEEGVWWKRN